MKKQLAGAHFDNSKRVAHRVSSKVLEFENLVLSASDLKCYWSQDWCIVSSYLVDRLPSNFAIDHRSPRNFEPRENVLGIDQSNLLSSTKLR